MSVKPRKQSSRSARAAKSAKAYAAARAAARPTGLAGEIFDMSEEQIRELIVRGNGMPAESSEKAAGESNPPAMKLLQINTGDAGHDSLVNHLMLGAATAYAVCLRGMTGLDTTTSPAGRNMMATAATFVGGFVRTLEPRDAVEWAIAAQMATAQGRLLFLTDVLVRANSSDAMDRVSGACDRATGTFRRLALASKEYRRTQSPPAPRTQVNVAENQQIVNADPSLLGRKFPDGQPQLPAHPGRTSLASSGHPGEQAVAEVDGAADGGGQASGEPQRMAARRAKRGDRTPTASGGGPAAAGARGR